jgi:hypothetical protein
MTATDEAEFLDWAFCQLSFIPAALEEQLGRPPSPSEICAALIMAVPPGITELAMDYTGFRSCR